jgi:hypothetical protein
MVGSERINEDSKQESKFINSNNLSIDRLINDLKYNEKFISFNEKPITKILKKSLMKG